MTQHDFIRAQPEGWRGRGTWLGQPGIKIWESGMYLNASLLGDILTPDFRFVEIGFDAATRTLELRFMKTASRYTFRVNPNQSGRGGYIACSGFVERTLRPRKREKGWYAIDLDSDHRGRMKIGAPDRELQDPY